LMFEGEASFSVLAAPNFFGADRFELTHG
jgi:hypothetical protein